MNESYVIASQRPWNAELAMRLESQTGKRFWTISSKHDLSAENMKKNNVKKIFFSHWSDRIPESIWQSFESIIFHMTDVPYGRGGSPLQNLIIRGHVTTTLSALRCVEGFDAGPVYLKRPLSLLGTAEEIFYRADDVIEKMITEIIKNKPNPVEQSGEPVIFKRRQPNDSSLENIASLEEAFNMIRMLDAEGYPHAFLETDDIKFEFRKVERVGEQLEATVYIKNKILEVKQ